MQFGELIRGTRLRRGESINKLATLTKVNPSTISRIENGEAEPSLVTAICLCDALGITANTLLREVYPDHQGIDVVVPSVTEEPALTVADIADFVTYFWNNIDEGLALLARELTEGRRALQLQQFPPYPPYTPDQVGVLLADTPLHESTWDQPPSAGEAQYYEGIYRAGGALTFAEIGQYTRILRKQPARHPAKYAEHRGLSASVINRIENASIEKLRLKSLLQLEQQYGVEGTLLGMYWDATKLTEQLRIIRINRLKPNIFRRYEDYYITEHKLALVLITICRWKLPFDEGQFHEWISSFRETIQHVFSQVALPE